MYRHVVLLLVTAAPAALATGRPVLPVPDGLACNHGIDATPRPDRMPEGLVRAISMIESGRLAASGGSVRPWPWTINVGGTGYFYQTKQQAVAAVRVLQDSGIRSIDVGCMQINLMYHPHAFATLDDAFEPSENVAYAVRFLSTLFHQTGSWPQAAAAYHSQTPQIGLDYQKRVMALYPMRQPVPSSRPVEVAEAGAEAGAELADNPTPEFLRLQRQSQEDHARLQLEHGRPVPAVSPAPARFRAARASRRSARTAASASLSGRAELLRLAGTGWLDGASEN